MGLIYNMLHSVSLENRKPSKAGVCISLNSASLTFRANKLKLLARLWIGFFHSFLSSKAAH